MGGGVALLAFLGGTWFPITSARLPARRRAVRSPPTGSSRPATSRWEATPWGTEAWVVIAGWTVVFAALARRAYRHDTGRV